MAKCEHVDWFSKKEPQTAIQSGAGVQTPECHRKGGPWDSGFKCL